MQENSDSFCERLLGKPNKAEALAWLRDAGDVSRTIGELDQSASLSVVVDLYSAGAERVIAVDIDTMPGIGESANALILVLPRDPIARKRLFDWEATHARKRGFDPQRDDGQRYLFLWWD